MDTPLKRLIADGSRTIEQRRAAFQEFNRQQQKCDKCQTPGTYRAGRCSGCITESQDQERAARIMSDAGDLVNAAREILEQIPGEWTGDECGRIESEIAGTARNLHAKAAMPDA